MTPDELREIMPYAKQRADLFAVPLSDAMAEFGIDTPARQAAFVAQVGHESGSLRYVEELASGDAYEGRHDLGNTQPGDGRRFKGRGLIQITGRTNYGACSQALLGDENALLDDPARLCDPALAARSAAWFWQKHNLNALADSGDFKTITKRINGGLNGYDDRLAFWDRAKTAMEVA